MAGWKSIASRVRQEMAYYRGIAAHPDTPRVSKWLLGLAIAYLVSPIDLIPDVIPILGQLDDIVVVPALVCLAMMSIPAHVKEEARRSSGPVT